MSEPEDFATIRPRKKCGTPKALGIDPVVPSGDSLEIKHALPVTAEGNGIPLISSGLVGSRANDHDVIDLKRAIELESNAWKEMARDHKMSLQLEADNDDEPIPSTPDLLFCKVPQLQCSARYQTGSGHGGVDGDMANYSPVNNPRSLKYKLSTPSFKRLARQNISEQEMIDAINHLTDQMFSIKKLIIYNQGIMFKDGDILGEIKKLTTAVNRVESKLPDAKDWLARGSLGLASESDYYTTKSANELSDLSLGHNDNGNKGSQNATSGFIDRDRSSNAHELADLNTDKGIGVTPCMSNSSSKPRYNGYWDPTSYYAVDSTIKQAEAFAKAEKAEKEKNDKILEDTGSTKENDNKVLEDTESRKEKIERAKKFLRMMASRTMATIKPACEVSPSERGLIDLVDEDAGEEESGDREDSRDDEEAADGQGQES